MPALAPSFVASAVAIIVGIQPLLGLSFTSDQWSTTIMVVCALVVVVRQVMTGKSTWFGSRPK